MPWSSRLPPNSDPADQAAYIWSRIDPRRNHLIRDKLRRATLGVRKEIDRETQRIRFENRLNSNKRGVDEKILGMWAGKIQAHAEMCYDKIFCHHWSLLGHRKTGAFVRACSAILGRHIDQLGNTEAHKAQMAHRRQGGVAQSLEGSYKSSAGLVRKQLEEEWDIEARELELAASIARSQKHPAPEPSRPTQRLNQGASTSPVAVVRPGEIVVEGGPLSSEETDPTAAAVELLQKLDFGAEEQGWPSPPFGPVLPSVLKELKQAHRILTTKGFLVVGDPLNPLGDGRSWVLRLEPTNKLPPDADFADLADQYLQSAGIKVAAKPIRDARTLLVALWDSGRVPIESTRNKREAFIRPRLESMGWSILDWAKNSGVDFHTANDYFKGETKPYPSTRKKLADSLGISAKDLPN